VFVMIKSQKSLEGGLKGSVDAILCLLWKELSEAYGCICVMVANASTSQKIQKQQASTFFCIKIDNNQPVCGVVASHKVMLKCKGLIAHLCTANKNQLIKKTETMRVNIF